MKLSLILAAIVNAAAIFGLPTEKDTIAKRQVDTALLRRYGTRRLSARQAGPSPGRQNFIVSEYINCPASAGAFALSGEQAMKYATETAGQQNIVYCSYRSVGDCRYDGDNGEPLSGNQVVCPASLSAAPATGACYQACPRQQRGKYYALSFLVSSGGAATTACYYSDVAFGPANTLCTFNTIDGTYNGGSSSADSCPTQLDASTFCMANIPA